MTTRVELFRSAKKILRGDLSLTDAQVAQQAGLPPHVVASFNGTTHEELAIVAARREVRQDAEAEAGRQHDAGKMAHIHDLIKGSG